MDVSTKDQIKAVQDGFHAVEDGLKALTPFAVANLSKPDLAKFRKMKRDLMAAHAIAAELADAVLPPDDGFTVLGGGT
jgi:hypothetical protein